MPQHALGGLAQERGQVVGAVALALYEAGDVAHGTHGFIGDGFDLREVCAGVLVIGQDVLGDERDAAEAAADFVMQILSDALAQPLQLGLAGFSLTMQPDEHGRHGGEPEEEDQAGAPALPALRDGLALGRDAIELVQDLAPLGKAGEPLRPVEDVGTAREAIHQRGL